MAKRKSKVLSVRLSLDSLQSCFDFCESIGSPTNGASGAIARTVEILTAQLRSQNKLPTYKESDLEILIASFIQAKNPTSMPSFEQASIMDSISVQSSPKLDFHPACALPISSIEPISDESIEELKDDLEAAQEYELLIQQQIKSIQQEDEDDLLKAITMGGS